MPTHARVRHYVDLIGGVLGCSPEMVRGVSTINEPDGAHCARHHREWTPFGCPVTVRVAHAVADEEQAALRKGLETEVREGTAERLAQWHRAEAAEAEVDRLRHHGRFLAAAIVQIAKALGAEIDTNLISPEVLLLAEQTAEEARNANAELADAREQLRRCEERLTAVKTALDKRHNVRTYGELNTPFRNGADQMAADVWKAMGPLHD